MIISRIRKSLRYRLLFLSLIIALVPTLLTGIFAFSLASRVIKNMATESNVELVERIALELDVILTDTFYLFNLVQNSELLQRAMKTEFKSTEERYAMDLTGSTELYFISEYKKHIFGLYIIGDNQGVYKSNYLSLTNTDFHLEEWYNTVFSSELLSFFPPADDSMMVKTGAILDSKYFSFGIPFIDKATGNRLGVIVVELQEDLFLKIMESTLGKTGYLVILDENNKPVISSRKDNSREADFTGLPEYSSLSLNEISAFKQVSRTDIRTVPEILFEQNNILIYTPLSIPNWKIVAVIPNRELMTDRNNAMILIIVILSGSCVLALILAWRFSGGIAKPVLDITGLMKNVRNGDLTVRTTIEMEDEIGQLATGFNKMVENVNDLMQEIYTEQVKLKNAELRLLQAQINPHFLYNTLDSIRYLVLKDKRDSAVKMVTSLAKFFRFSLSRGREVVTIGDEIKRIENYLIIQKMRYNEKFDYSIEIEDDCSSYIFLKLLLQPLVENAIYHGIKESPGRGEIKITVKKDDIYLNIEVTDTGAGLEESELTSLEKQIREKNTDDSGSYGLTNVQERIRIFFGPGFEMKFRSVKNMYFKVIIHIPALTEEKHFAENSIS